MLFENERYWLFFLMSIYFLVLSSHKNISVLELIKSGWSKRKNMLEETYNLEKSESLNWMVQFLMQFWSFCFNKYVEKG